MPHSEVTFGDRINQDNIILDTFQVAGRNIRRSRIDKLTIYLVGEKEKVVLLHKVTYLIHLAASVKIAGRIIGITNKDGTCTVVNKFLELFYLRQLKNPLLWLLQSYVS